MKVRSALAEWLARLGAVHAVQADADLPLRRVLDDVDGVAVDDGDDPGGEDCADQVQAALGLAPR